MNKEIKEILDKLRSDDYYEKEYQKSVYYERDLKKLEDYITNLQQENESLKEDKKKAIEYIEDNVAVYAFNNKTLPHWEFDDNNINDLLNILQNGSENDE